MFTFLILIISFVYINNKVEAHCERQREKENEIERKKLEDAGEL